MLWGLLFALQQYDAIFSFALQIIGIATPSIPKVTSLTRIKMLVGR